MFKIAIQVRALAQDRLLVAQADHPLKRVTLHHLKQVVDGPHQPKNPQVLLMALVVILIQDQTRARDQGLEVEHQVRMYRLFLRVVVAPAAQDRDQEAAVVLRKMNRAVSSRNLR